MKRTPAAVDKLLTRYSDGLMWFLRRERVSEEHVGPLWASIFMSVLDAVENESLKTSDNLDELVWTVARRQLAIHVSRAADGPIAGMRLLDCDRAHAARLVLEELRPRD